MQETSKTGPLPSWMGGAAASRLAAAAIQAGLALCYIWPSSSAAQINSADQAWSQHLREDARSLHDVIARDHPGAVDPENSAFGVTLERGLDQALERAAHTKDFPGYYWAMQSYAASFDDAHLTVRTTALAPQLSYSWPGFLTAYRGSTQVVVTREGAADGPPMDAELVSCDGLSADELAAERVGAFYGRWFLESQRVALSAQVFLDRDNPWTERPASCVFRANGRTSVYQLSWRGLTREAVTARLEEADGRSDNALKIAPIKDGFWIGLPSFNGDPSSTDAAKLTSLVEEAQTLQTALRSARLIVLDLRGNEGGSSQWGSALAKIIWGDDWLAAHPPRSPTAVDWRASTGNIEALQTYAAEYRSEGDADSAYFSEIADHLAEAQSSGAVYWRQIPSNEDTASGVRSLVQPVVRVVVVTDHHCFSACLDAVDLWKAAGAVQVGRVTGADTVYIENRSAPLSTPFMRANLSMKVYRGRARGNNEPQIPDEVFPGVLPNQPQLLAWIEALPDKRSSSQALP